MSRVGVTSRKIIAGKHVLGGETTCLCITQSMSNSQLGTGITTFPKCNFLENPEVHCGTELDVPSEIPLSR